MRPVPDSTPVLVGIGCVTQRSEDPHESLEPLDLMIEAVKRAGSDTGQSSVLREVEHIAVPRGRWNYRNPGGAIRRAIGAGHAKSILSSAGVLQQSLIAEVCHRIADGEIQCAIVTGADAGYRLLRARLTGLDPTEQEQTDDPDLELNPAAELRHPAELAVGLAMPVGLYAILDSAVRSRAGRSISGHRDDVASIYARFSQIAAQNADAWSREPRSASEIREPRPGNPMQAFPYTKALCSSWNVDQAAALLFCSAGHAAALGIDRKRWVFPLVSAESNHMTPVSARADLAACPGADVTSRVALEAAGLRASEIDLFELYSCFPVAVGIFAKAIGLPAGRDLSVTGSMAYAGGPYNNYFLQATCKAAELLRSGCGRTALLSCVSGILTKQAVAIWSATPDRAFESIDTTEEVARATKVVKVCEDYRGVGQIAGYTVIHERGGSARAIALLDTPEGRVLASSSAQPILASFESDDWVGRRVNVMEGGFAA